MTANKKHNPTSKSTKKKAWGTKQVLASPFAPTFPSPNPSTRNAVLEILLETFPVPFAQRVPKPRPTRPSKPDGTGEASLPTDVALDKDIPGAEVTKKCKKPSGLLCGINEVTKALENDHVDIVVVSRDVVPSILVSHLPVLCYLKSAKLVVMPGNGAEMGEILGTRRLLTFAIKRDARDAPEEHSLMKRLAEKLAPFATKLDYPWLAAAKGGPVPPLPEPMVIPHRSKNDIG